MIARSEAYVEHQAKVHLRFMCCLSKCSRYSRRADPESQEGLLFPYDAGIRLKGSQQSGALWEQTRYTSFLP
jgi:hypothetical protein